MTVEQAESQSMNAEDCLVWEAEQEERHEFVGG
jgi:hypothetical protein